MRMISVLFCFILLLCCCGISKQKINKLKLDSRALYPNGENGHWGFADTSREIVIPLTFEEVCFFTGSGLAMAKLNGKYGFVNKSGEWHIKPKYDRVTPFEPYAWVWTGSDSLLIDITGCYPKPFLQYGRCGGGSAPSRIDDHFVLINGKYEFLSLRFLRVDSTTVIELCDTSNIGFDQVYEFGTQYMLVEKAGKFGICNVFPASRIVLSEVDRLKSRVEDEIPYVQLVDLKYDDVKFELSGDHEVLCAVARIGDTWGMIDRSGRVVLPFNYLSLEYLDERRPRLLNTIKAVLDVLAWLERSFFSDREC